MLKIPAKRPPKDSPMRSYQLEIVSLPEECELDEFLPLEIRYVFKKHPHLKAEICEVLKHGKAIGVRTVLRTPESVLSAIHTISVYSQHNYILNWLPPLLKHKHQPTFTQGDYSRAKEHGEDLDRAVDTILADRLRFKRIVIVDEDNVGITEEERKLVVELSEIIYPIAVDYSVFRVVIDNAQERTAIAQSIIKALFVIGPIAHFLEKFASGFGKLFAASADDLLGEAAELMALRGSGFTWRELARRAKVLIPVFALATWGAFSVEGFLERGQVITAGVVFGLSAVALSLTTAVQSVFMYHENAKRLVEENKFRSTAATGLFGLSIRQNLTNPARLGLLIGASMAPVLGIAGAVSGLMHNGWVLAVIGSTESIVAGLTVISAHRFNEWRFRRKVGRMIG